MRLEVDSRAYEVMQEYYDQFKYEPAEEPSISWVESFMKKYSFTTRRENRLEKERSENASVGNLKFWFEKIGREVDMSKIDKCMIGNLDETMLNTKGRSLCIVKKGSRYAVTQDDEGKHHITILQVIIGGGSTFIPMFIFNLKKVPTYLDTLVKARKLFVAGQKKGWISDDLFTEYMEKFADWLPEYRKSLGLPADAPFLLFSDSHGSRKNWDLLTFCKNHHIIIVTSPSHCTQYCNHSTSVCMRYSRSSSDRRKEVWQVQFLSLREKSPAILA
jgi:hypothetical protein